MDGTVQEPFTSVTDPVDPVTTYPLQFVLVAPAEGPISKLNVLLRRLTGDEKTLIAGEEAIKTEEMKSTTTNTAATTPALPFIERGERRGPALAVFNDWEEDGGHPYGILTNWSMALMLSPGAATAAH